METVLTNLETSLKNIFLSFLDKIQFFFNSFSWEQLPISILDVVLSGIVIYWIWIVFKETKISRFSSVIITLFILLIFGRLFHLTTLYWLLRYILLFLIIAIPITFQQEFRAAFEKFFKKTRARIGIEGGLSVEYLDKIIDAAKLMAHQRIGGLIVIQREQDLSQYSEGGTKMEAAISTELIVSLFSPQSPLHDGAIIILGNYIVAAGCMLPLDNEQYPEYQLGARHRAALGISNLTDALAVVISAEKGTISLADGGILDVDLTPAELRRSLMEGMKVK